MKQRSALAKYNYVLIFFLGLLISPNLQTQTVTTVETNETVVIDSNGQDFTKNGRIDNYKAHDKSGLVMTITAMGLVFVGLIVLYLLFIMIGSAAVSLSIKRAMKVFGVTKEEAKGITAQSGDIYAAIAMAIYEATELHDEENTILTIKNTVRNYSPWSSKIYTLREMPRR